MPDDAEELRELKRQNAALREKEAKAIQDWHEEVRKTLARLSEDMITVKANTAHINDVSAEVKALEARVKILEDFKVKLIAYMTVAGLVIAAFWKVIDKIWK